MTAEYAVSQPPATSSAPSYQPRTEYDYSGQQHPHDYDRHVRQDSWPGSQVHGTQSADSPFPLHQTFSPHIPPASTGAHHQQQQSNGIGSPFPPYSPHSTFGDALSGNGGATASSGLVGASPQHDPTHGVHPLHQHQEQHHHSAAAAAAATPHVGEGTGVPEIGHVRCYWAILSAELEYAYLGPVFAAHLGEEVAERLKGTSLLDWVHPDERDQLAKDLLPHPDRLAGVEETGVFGSVTRFVLSMRRQLQRTRSDLDE
ncbi:hypothetical protein JCM3774_004552, partial [Rhodotorula dairenensis]